MRQNSQLSQQIFSLDDMEKIINDAEIVFNESNLDFTDSLDENEIHSLDETSESTTNDANEEQISIQYSPEEYEDFGNVSTEECTDNQSNVIGGETNNQDVQTVNVPSPFETVLFWPEEKPEPASKRKKKKFLVSLPVSCGKSIIGQKQKKSENGRRKARKETEESRKQNCKKENRRVVVI
ncbi:hypothetical protein HHI36_015326 [Cryptolaemus montrouzieri]|uniref:Uncharacterized protein n=1 Tax=Cryptolaemus montrouzieri TaxID=559131 RepID=A0ABD2N5E4_9CUCU